MVKVTQIGHAHGDPVDRLAAAGVMRQGPSKLAVTAARNSDGRLEVVVWAVSNNGTPSVAARRVEGPVSEVGVHDVGELRFVVSVRDDEGRLRLIAYTVSENGKTLTRVPGTTMVGKPVRDFAITSSDSDSVTVAQRQNDRRVVVSTWTLAANGGFGTEQRVPLGDGKVTALDVAGVNQEFCFTAATETGTHRLRAFKGPDALGGAATGSKVRSVAISSSHAFTGYWTACIDKDNVAVRTGPSGITGRLILDTGVFDVAHWEFESGAFNSPLVRTATSRLDGMAGIAWELRVLVTPENLCYVLASGADTYETLPKNQGKPKMRLFAFERQGDKIVRVGQGNAKGKHSLIALARLQFIGTPTTHSARFFTAARDGNGKLKVAVWDVTD